MEFSRSAVLRYTLLPQFLPRFSAFFKSGFTTIAYLIAIIFEAANLLPKGHPYLNSTNIGKYGIRHVIAQGANHLVFSKKHIDQIVIYFTIIIGLVLLATQFILLTIAISTEQPAFAQIDKMTDILGVESKYNPGPEQDIAFIIMDRVFGVEDIFESCVSTGEQCLDARGNPTTTPKSYPFPIHKGLHTMLQFYSYGIFIISVFVILYFVTRMVGETAATGVPFGEKINKTWVPIRLIIFLGLLIPLNLNGTNAGLNGAQIITLWSAKLGSNFATNGWGKFVEDTNSEFLGKAESLIAEPNPPELGELVKFMFVAKTCKIVEEMAYGHDIQPYIIREQQPQSAQLVGGDNSRLLSTMDFKTAYKFANRGNIAIRFGVKGPESGPLADDYKSYKGHVDPICGELKLSTTGGAEEDSGTAAIQEIYYKMVNNMWRDETMNKRAECIVRNKFPQANTQDCSELPDEQFALERINKYQTDLKKEIPKVIEKQVGSGEWDISNEVRKKGWGGAAIWYNQVASLNGEVTTAILALPQPSQYTKVLKSIAQQHAMMSDNVNPADPFNPILPNGKQVHFERNKGKDQNIAKTTYAAYKFWNNDALYKSNTRKPVGNSVIDGINAIFGTSGVFDIKKNTDIHPLAQLSTVGRGMMEASLRNLGLGIVGEGGGALLAGTAGKASKAGGQFFTKIGFATIAISFVLFYVLPFLPFVYFLFAIGGWVKSIFEAMAAMPLWALAHIIRTDGEGIPGPAASNGYFLILEIFVRPILIVFGLLGSIVIFSSFIVILNEIFDFVVTNVSGASGEETGAENESLVEFMRGPVDEFFYTVLYTIIVYIIGMSTFKMIDLVPNQILRFIGSAVATFQESDKDPASALVERTYQGTTIATQDLKGGALAALVA